MVIPHIAIMGGTGDYSPKIKQQTLYSEINLLFDKRHSGRLVLLPTETLSEVGQPSSSMGPFSGCSSS